MKAYSILTGLLFFIMSCNDNKNNDGPVYGAPSAKVTSTPNNQRELVGPLTYGPGVPKIVEADTVVVKMDARHRLFQISPEVFSLEFVLGCPGLSLKCHGPGLS